MPSVALVNFLGHRCTGNVRALVPIAIRRACRPIVPLTRLLNGPAMLRCLREHRPDKSVWDLTDDLELAHYGTIFDNNFLHHGYFPDQKIDPGTIGFADLNQAMDDYATLLVQRVQPGERVLDVGCGMGGLLARLDQASAQPADVTPNRAHAAHIKRTWPDVSLIDATFETVSAGAAWQRSSTR
jgi:SAM-dependent methyltransferase